MVKMNFPSWSTNCDLASTYLIDHISGKHRGRTFPFNRTVLSTQAQFKT